MEFCIPFLRLARWLASLHFSVNIIEFGIISPPAICTFQKRLYGGLPFFKNVFLRAVENKEEVKNDKGGKK